MNTIDVKLKSNGNYWQAWWKPESAERQTRSIGPKSKLSERQAQAKCRQLAVDLATGKQRSESAPKLSAWLETFDSLVAHEMSDGTKSVIEFTGRLLKAHFDNDPPIDKITRLDAAEWAAEVASGKLSAAIRVYPKKIADVKRETRYHKYRKELEKADAFRIPSAASVAKYVRCAKRIFSEATEEDGVGLIGMNPFRRLNGRAPVPEKNWAKIDASDMKAILGECPNNGWRALFVLCRWAGVRRGEALWLDWPDIVWARNRMNIYAGLNAVTTKKKPRVCPIDPAKCPTGLAAMLKEYFDAAVEGTSKVCQGVDIDNIDKVARAIVRRAGVAAYDKPFHALRKNRAGEVARAGYPLHVHCAWFGHSAEVAQAYYLRVEEEDYFMPGAAERGTKRGTESGNDAKLTRKISSQVAVKSAT